MSLQFATKDKVWCVLMSDMHGNPTNLVLYFSIDREQCVDWMKERGVAL